MAVRRTATAPKAADKKKAFVFFNCDEEKNHETMNIVYNHDVYQDTKKARKELWAKIEEELKADRIYIEEASLAVAQQAVLDGDPAEASQHIQYGAIITVTSH